MTKERIIKTVTAIIFFLILGNVIFLDIKTFLPDREKIPAAELPPPADNSGQAAEPTAATTIPSAGSGGNSCPLACRETIKSEIDSAIAALPTQAPATVVKIKTPTTAPQIAYLPLDGGSSTIEQSWTEITGSDFIFDLADYPANAVVYWQGNLRARDDNSRCYARLYDEDNNRAVDYSEQSTEKTTYETLTSQPLAIWRGKNHYHIDIKSLNGFICYVDSPRLIIRY